MINPYQEREIIKRILSLFKPHRKKIIIVIACICITSVINMFLPLISQRIIDQGILRQEISLVIKLAGLSFLFVILNESLGMLETNYLAQINSLISFTLSKTAFKHLLKLRIEFFNNANATEILHNIELDVNTIGRISDRSTFFIIAQILRIIGGVIGLFLINWKMALGILCLIPLRYIVVKYLSKERERYVQNYIDSYQVYSEWYGDSINGIKEIKLYGLERIKIGQLIKKQREIVKTNIRLSLIDRLNELSEMILMQIVINFIYIIGGYIIFNFKLTIGGLFAFITYATYVTGPVSAILGIGYSLAGILPSAKRLFQLLDMECEMEDNEKKANKISPNWIEIQGAIRFENVSFSYKNGRKILKNINFEIEAGEKIAIIGKNGSGKTTLINLLLRLYKPDDGKIFLDDVDISKMRLQDYRRIITIVTQDVYLFKGTIQENITFSRKEKDKLPLVLQQSGANEFIETLPLGYQTIIGNNGNMISGGEKQKIALARALLPESNILILDEATSNYDVYSELRINEHLLEFLNGKTVIIISHRPEILSQVDKIILLDNGCIRKIENHEELLARNPAYSNIVENRKKAKVI